MATITEKARGDIGGKAWRFYSWVATAGAAATMTLTAASIGLSYIETCMAMQGKVTSFDAGLRMSTDAGAYVDFVTTSIDVGDEFFFQVTGW